MPEAYFYAKNDDIAALRNECDEKTALLQKQLEALFKANRGSEDMPDEQIDLVKELASQTVDTFYKGSVYETYAFKYVLF